MKMAKASENDIDAAGELMRVLNDISSGYYPAKDGEYTDDIPTLFDPDDYDHLRHFYDLVSATLDKAPGYQGRVIGGMCYVILYDKNEIVDPEADTLELHPKLQKALDESLLIHDCVQGLLADQDFIRLVAALALPYVEPTAAPASPSLATERDAVDAQQFKPRELVTLNGKQLKDLLDYAWPDKDDEDQADSELTLIAHDTPFKSTEGDDMPAGLYCYCTEYPEEGIIMIDEKEASK